MLTALVVMGIAVVLAFMVAAGLWTMQRELREHLRETRQDRDILRQEVQLLTDALARGNRTPVMREPAKPLTKLETWYEGRPQVTTFTVNS